ncbi:hydroxyethylthiazole kinase [Arenibaculum pallidiluteum]|uniref:hydroxyethylthiazole kinase n=1 Tax=Arenibaculum pallidiluteum TaxID=2812559 RepID=UPI001A9687BC|nr:hydroxyethylthiazole kinase [Arenibaculum pallidiluteum]
MDAAKAAELLDRMCRRRPLIQNITNYVSMDIAANVLLAAGASPAMVHAAEEAGDFVALADSLVVNIGTLSPAWVEGMRVAADRASALGKPWVLDPVGVGATRLRDVAAADLLGRRPSVVRGNASEILSLAQGFGTPHGVDSAHDSADAVDAARRLAAHSGAVVAVTGRVDYVTDGTRLVAVEGGSPLMTLVTAVGCSVSALVAAFLPVAEDPLEGSAAALAFAAVTGESAAAGEPGPGTFRVRWIDALHALGPDDLGTRARIRRLPDLV